MNQSVYPGPDARAALRLSEALARVADGSASASSQNPEASIPALAGLAVIALEGERKMYEGAWGRRFVHPEDSTQDLPLTTSSLFRVASLSKPVTCLGAMLLVEEGLLDLEKDVSDYLGFRLRNPSWPDIPITTWMLLSHTSSLRDGIGYWAPLGARLEDFFRPGSELYESGGHFAGPESGSGTPGAPAAGYSGDRAPGFWYEYCNLNYGVLATIMERLSGERFDRFMKRRVFQPLGIEASYNVAELSPEAFARLGTLYRKAPGEEGPWDPAGSWMPQVDDYRGQQPAMSFRAGPGLAPGLTGPERERALVAELDRYEPGVNGTLFSPQGGLRISAEDYAKILALLVGGGEYRGTRLLRKSSIDMMLHSRWVFDPEAPNGATGRGLSRETGLALFRSADARDSFGCDWLLRGGGARMWMHHGDAYGFLGGMFFDPETKRAFIYFTTGPAHDPETHRGSWSDWIDHEEYIQDLVLREVFGLG